MFQDILSQTVAGATAPVEGETGGINPRQIGLGVSTAAIDVVHSPGSPMTTNLSTDLSIDGDGFFVVSAHEDGEVEYLTRTGNFTRDAGGFLVNAQGYFVLGADGDPIEISRDRFSMFSINKYGIVEGTDIEDGETTDLGTLGIATVNNPGGLLKVGENL